MGPSVHGLKEFNDGPSHKSHLPGSRLKTLWKGVEDTQMLLEQSLEKAVRETFSKAVDIAPSKNSNRPQRSPSPSPTLKKD